MHRTTHQHLSNLNTLSQTVKPEKIEKTVFVDQFQPYIMFMLGFWLSTTIYRDSLNTLLLSRIAIPE